MSGKGPDPVSRSVKQLAEKLRSSGRAADAGWTLSGSVIGCLLIGYMLGEHFGWNPAATVIGLVIGLVVGMYNLAKIMGLFG